MAVSTNPTTFTTLCPAHRALMRAWKRYRFDADTGDRWGMGPGALFNEGCGGNSDRAIEGSREHRAREWKRSNEAMMNAIAADCASGHGCADTPTILEWITTGPRMWRAEADGLVFTVDNLTNATWLTITTDDMSGETVLQSRHPDPKYARRAALQHWEVIKSK